jgi:hypothetical protein
LHSSVEQDDRPSDENLSPWDPGALDGWAQFHLPRVGFTGGELLQGVSKTSFFGRLLKLVTTCKFQGTTKLHLFASQRQVAYFLRTDSGSGFQEIAE